MGSEELFHYDAMNRLVTARKRELDAVNLDLWDLPTPGGDWDQQTESRYDGQYSGGDDPDGVAPGAGNLTHKGGASQYYGANAQCDTTTGPHAVCATGPEGGEATVQYTYDDNGNQIQRQTNDTVDRSIDYTVFNKVWRVSSGQGTTKYWYDAERRRFKREDVGERFVFYIANTEVIRQNGTTTYRRQVAGAMVRFEPHNDQDVANSPRAYRITDHGSQRPQAASRRGPARARWPLGGVHVAIHKLKSIHEPTQPARVPDGVAERVQGSDDPPLTPNPPPTGLRQRLRTREPMCSTCGAGG